MSGHHLHPLTLASEPPLHRVLALSCLPPRTHSACASSTTCSFSPQRTGHHVLLPPFSRTLAPQPMLLPQRTGNHVLLLILPHTCSAAHARHSALAIMCFFPILPHACTAAHALATDH